MDTFSSQQRTKTSLPVTEPLVLSKQEVLSFIKSIDFNQISIPSSLANSDNEEDMGQFITAVCTALENEIILNFPPNTSLKTLIHPVNSSKSSSSNDSVNDPSETESREGEPS